MHFPQGVSPFLSASDKGTCQAFFVLPQLLFEWYLLPVLVIHTIGPSELLVSTLADLCIGLFVGVGVGAI